MKKLMIFWLMLLTLTSSLAQSNLPAPAKCYFETIEAKNLDAFVNCFATDAVILDVSREIKGRAAIRTWAKNEVVGGQYTLLESKITKDGVSVLLRFAPSGYPNGFRARYEFMLRDGKIVSMNLQYA
jgi:hypothetical protein